MRRGCLEPDELVHFLVEAAFRTKPLATAAKPSSLELTADDRDVSGSTRLHEA